VVLAGPCGNLCWCQVSNSLLDLKLAVGVDIIAAVHHDELSIVLVAMIGVVVVVGLLKIVGKSV
jgi:hypothetical protein